MENQKSPIFISTDMAINSWEDVKPYFENLAERALNNSHDLHQWLLDRSMLEAMLEEDMGWRYIRMTCDTTDKEREQRYLTFVSEIEPQIAPYHDLLNRKMAESAYLSILEKPEYHNYIRSVKEEIKIFREENIPLQTEIQTEQQKYAAISGAMTVTVDDKEQTLQQAANYYKSNDRAKRQQVYEQITKRRYQDAEDLEDLFDVLLKLRHQVAVNAGFANFRDYMFVAMGRFDYTVNDCEMFHQSVKNKVVPMVRELLLHRKERLGLDKLRPWDTEVDLDGHQPLKPFADGKDLLNKTIQCFDHIDPFFKQVINTMIAQGHFDVESRIGKAPGGYNYPLPVNGYPFIFMNAASNTRDVETMVHEAGHAFHSVLTKDLELNAQKALTSEIAELASMSMELISSHSQNVFYTNPDDHKRARLEHLEGIIEVLPWVATVDKFQHWLYTNPGHTRAERGDAWLRISQEFSGNVVDWEGYEKFRPYSWHKQLHIFEVPFYYIEYGFAQLGAVGVWRNYLQNPTQTLQQYKEALSLGYTQSIPDIYKTAGVKFDFSENYIGELVAFVSEQMKSLS
ncbi:MAG: M3 family oligoendopeptidase [Bacteroidota bacterium]|nr:M3 family oligoendopeptidase [Bacteroidota bacterium]